MEELKKVLEDLKKNGKVKEYEAPPEGTAKYSGYLLTYCLEETIAGIQPTLAVSKLDRSGFDMGAEMVNSIEGIFGRISMISFPVFPKRGPTAIFVFEK